MFLRHLRVNYCIYCICSWMVLCVCMPWVGVGGAGGAAWASLFKHLRVCRHVVCLPGLRRLWLPDFTHLPATFSNCLTLILQIPSNTHTHTYSIIPFRGAGSDHTMPCRRHVTCTRYFSSRINMLSSQRVTYLRLRRNRNHPDGLIRWNSFLSSAFTKSKNCSKTSD